MKRYVKNYTFDHVQKTITFNLPDFYNVELERLLLITDVTNGTVIYQFNNGNLNGSISTNVLTLDYNTNTNAFANTDVLQIIYDFADGGKLALFPETNVLMDDNFDDGFCGWGELYQFPTDWNTSRYLPLTLSDHGAFGRYSLKMQSANTYANQYGGGGLAIKRINHRAQPNVVHKGIIKEEFWFSFGADSQATTDDFDSVAPRNIQFLLDSEYPLQNTTTSNRGLGARAAFQLVWQQSLISGSNNNYTGQWYLCQGSGYQYGQGGYVQPGNVGVFATGYYTNFPFNQNKKNIQYVAVVWDTLNGLPLGLQANDLYFDLTKIPSNGNAPLPSMLAIGDPTYNVAEFYGGLNPYIGINNVLSGSWLTASWLELHRCRVSYL